MSTTTVDIVIEDTVPEECREQISKAMRVCMQYVPLVIDEIVFTSRYEPSVGGLPNATNAMFITPDESSSRVATIGIFPDAFRSLTDQEVLQGILYACAIHVSCVVSEWYEHLATNPTLFNHNELLLNISRVHIPALALASYDAMGEVAGQIVADVESAFNSTPMQCTSCDHGVDVFIAPSMKLCDVPMSERVCPECGGLLEFVK